MMTSEQEAALPNDKTFACTIAQKSGQSWVHNRRSKIWEAKKDCAWDAEAMVKKAASEAARGCV